jgi:hypothetical protein
MAIVGQNALLNQYVPTFYIKNIQDGQILKFDSVRKAFVNVDGNTAGGANRLGELLDVSPQVDNPLLLQDGQALVYDSATSLWKNQFIDYSTLTNKPNIPVNSSFSFIGLSDTAKPALPAGYVMWNSTGTSLVYSTTIDADTVVGLATVAYTGDYNDLINKPDVGSVTLTGDVTGSGVSTIETTLATVNTAVGTFGSGLVVPQITVDAKGRILDVVNVPISVAGIGTVTDVSVIAEDGILASVADSSTTPIITLGLGDITPLSVSSTGNITGLNLSGVNTGDQTIEISGDATGSGTGPITLTLNTVNLAPGVYGDSHLVPTIEVNEKGLVTSITTQHVDTTARDLVPEEDVFVVQSRHQYIVTSQLEVDGFIENHGVIAIL